jgi:hypothetical protein
MVISAASLKQQPLCRVLKFRINCRPPDVAQMHISCELSFILFISERISSGLSITCVSLRIAPFSISAILCEADVALPCPIGFQKGTAAPQKCLDAANYKLRYRLRFLRVRNAGIVCPVGNNPAPFYPIKVAQLDNFHYFLATANVADGAFCDEPDLHSSIFKIRVCDLLSLRLKGLRMAR